MAHHLESLARRLAPTVALLITLAILTYEAGYWLGRTVHTTNDWLAAHWPTRPTTGTAAAPVPAPAPAPAPLAEVIATTGAVVTVTHCQQTTTALRLRAEGWTQQAIADHLGVSRTTVRRRLAAAQ